MSDAPKQKQSLFAKFAAVINYLDSVEVGSKQLTEELLESFVILLGSGVGVAEVVDSMVESAEKKSKRLKLQQLQQLIQYGYPLWKALHETKIVDESVVEVIKIGELNGRLEQNLKFVLTQVRKRKVFRSKVISALAYPIFLLLVTFVIALGISWFTLPRITDILLRLNVELQPTTRLLISFGELMEQSGGVVVLGSISILGAIIYILFVFGPTKFIGQFLMMQIPALRRVIVELEMARLGYTLGNLLKAGMPIDKALEAMAAATEMQAYQKLYRYLHQSILVGTSLHDAIHESKLARKLMAPSVRHLIWNAEESGTLEDTLVDFGKRYEEKLEETTKLLTVLLEPVMLVVVWLVILFIAISVLQPIYSVIGGLESARSSASTTI